jgi:hypothetical protein
LILPWVDYFAEPIYYPYPCEKILKPIYLYLDDISYTKMNIPAPHQSFPVLCGSLNIPKSNNDLANKFAKSKQMLNVFSIYNIYKRKHL